MEQYSEIRTTDMHNNVNGYEGIIWYKNPNPKIYTLSDYIYVTVSKWQNYSDWRRTNQGLPEVKSGGKGCGSKETAWGSLLVVMATAPDCGGSYTNLYIW